MIWTSIKMLQIETDKYASGQYRQEGQNQIIMIKQENINKFCRKHM